jgi:hypothetical protein
MAYNRSVTGDGSTMGDVYWRGGTQELAKPMAIAWLKMEDICIFCNAIKKIWQKKVIKVKRWKPFNLQVSNGIGTIV